METTKLFQILDACEPSVAQIKNYLNHCETNAPLENSEIFRIFDACEPTIDQIKTYLQQKAKNSPFELIFVKDGKEKITSVIEPGLGELRGIVIENYVFYTESFGAEHIIEPDEVSGKDIFDFGQKKIHPRAEPLNKKTLQILCSNYFNYCKLQDMLAVFGYNLNPLPGEALLLTRVMEDCVGNYVYNSSGVLLRPVFIKDFLKEGNRVLFTASWQ